MKKIAIFVFLVGKLAFAQCINGQVSVDHQCLTVGNQLHFSFLNVYAAHKGYKTQGGTQILISGKGYTESFGGSFSAPIPLVVQLELSDPTKAELLMNQLQTCYQTALLSMSGKEKYLFSLALSSTQSLPKNLVVGGDGQFQIQLKPHSDSSEYLIQCGNSLKGL